jgi:hypothetical protein
VRRTISVVSVLFVLCAAVAGAGELSVPITVQEPSGIARTAEPVSGGIPLPWGVYKKGQPFALYDGNKAISLQAIPHVVDEKGFIRWLLLDFQTDLKPNEKKTFTLKTVGEIPRAVVLAREVGGNVAINTGKVALAIAKNKPFGLFTTAAVTGGEVSYTDAWSKKTHKAGVPESVVVEYNGAMRATVCVKGKFIGDDQTKMGYVCRITAWAGKSAVHVKYSLANSNSVHYAYRQIGDSSITLKLAGGVKGTLLGASKPLAAGADASLKQGLRASSAGAAKATDGGKAVWTSAGSKDMAQGWILAKTGAANVYASDIYFRDDPARQLAVKNGSLVLTGSTERYDGKGAPHRAKHRVLFDCSHHTSEYLIDLAAPADGAELGRMANAARRFCHAMAPPAWYFETESLAVGKFGTQKDEIKANDTWGWTYKPGSAPTSPGYKIRVPRYVLGVDVHFDTEEDVAESLVLMYLRTGARNFFEAGHAWTNYYCDRGMWRTNGWRWKDGGVWKRSGPLGNRPQRGKDPVTGSRNYCPGGKTKVLEPGAANDMYYMSISSQCKCHNYGSGLAAWYCITGDRDALEAAVDSVEQQYDSQKRAFAKVPGKTNGFSRDFTRSAYLVNATRLAAPTDKFVIEASDWMADLFLKRPRPSQRGFVCAPGPLRIKGWGAFGGLKKYVGEPGLKKMKELGVTFSNKDGQLHDPKTGAKWYPLVSPHTWMFPPLSGAMDCYYRITGNEDAHDWVIAYGQGVSRVLFQPKHYNLSYGSFLVDFPVKGFAWDHASWHVKDDSAYGKGFRINGYLARFHPDVCARAYSLTGETILKQRAKDYWFGGSHRGYNAPSMHKLGQVAIWANTVGVHDETVCFTGRTFYEWSHPRADAAPPAAIRDLKVTLNGGGSAGLTAGQATVTFSAPADQGGGKVARYQLKCSDKPIVDYATFLHMWQQDKDAEATNWWMATNLNGELAPKRVGAKEAFAVTGVPKGAKYFALRSFDDSSNRSVISNVVELK